LRITGAGDLVMLRGSLYFVGILGVDIGMTVLLFHFAWMWLGE